MDKKIERYETKIKRLREWKSGNPQGPVSIHLDTTNRCNQECVFCWQRSHERKGWIDYDNELSEEKLLDIVDEAADLGVVHWLLSGGGEPMLRKETTINVMEKIKEHDMHGDIITNGTLFNEDYIERLVRCGWDRVRFSINGPRADVHDMLVGRENAFEEAIKSIISFNKYKRKYL